MHAGIAAEALGLLFRIWIQKRKLELQFGEEPVVASADPLEVPAPTMNPATGATATKGASPFSVDLQYAHEMLELQTYLIKSCKSADRAPRVTLAQDIDEPFAI
jgi:hypothetical protein